LITSRTPLNIKVLGQRSRSDGFCALRACMIPLEPVGQDSRNVIR